MKRCKADLEFDSALSDFFMFGLDTQQTVELTSIVNGLGIFISTFIFALMTGELE